MCDRDRRTRRTTLAAHRDSPFHQCFNKHLLQVHRGTPPKPGGPKVAQGWSGFSGTAEVIWRFLQGTWTETVLIHYRSTKMLLPLQLLVHHCTARVGSAYLVLSRCWTSVCGVPQVLQYDVLYPLSAQYVGQTYFLFRLFSVGSVLGPQHVRCACSSDAAECAQLFLQSLLSKTVCYSVGLAQYYFLRTQSAPSPK